MPFKKEPRFLIRRSIGIRWAYLNADGKETVAPIGFGENWSDGEPATYPMRRALNIRDSANLGVGRDACYEVVPNIGSYNA
jgi:hypothetical protein